MVLDVLFTVHSLRYWWARFLNTSRSLRTEARNLEIQGGEDVDILRRPDFHINMLRVHFWNMDRQTGSAQKWTVQKDESRRSWAKVRATESLFVSKWTVIVDVFKFFFLGRLLSKAIYFKFFGQFDIWPPAFVHLDHPLWPNAVLCGFTRHSISDQDQDPCRLFYTWLAHKTP